MIEYHVTTKPPLWLGTDTEEHGLKDRWQDLLNNRASTGWQLKFIDESILIFEREKNNDD